MAMVTFNRRRVTVVLGAAFLAGMLLLPVAADRAAAGMYRWVDSSGTVHYSDEFPGDVSSETHIEKVPSISSSPEQPPEQASDTGGARENSPPAASGAARDAGEPAASVGETPKVELYGTDWCPHCRKAREFLRSRGIAFDDYDIEKDPEAARRKKELNPGGGVPTTVINGRVINGFSEAAFENALKARGR